MIFIFISLVRPASALVSFPEYTILSEKEVRLIEGPGLIGSEFQSDVLGFSKPFHLENRFIRANKAFDLTTGSLGPKRFLTNNRLKLNTALSEMVEFKLIYFDQADFERQFGAVVYEFAFRFGDFALAGYGQTDTYKSEDDIGIALLYHWANHHTWRWFATAVDFSFNKRNLGSDTYSRKPYAFGFVGRWWSDENDDSYLEYSWRWEPLSERRELSQNSEYRYANQVINLHGRWALSELTFINFDGVWRKRFEERVQSLSLSREGWDADQLDVLGQFESWQWIFGLKGVYRHWRSELGSVTHEDWLPHLWWKAFRRDHSFGQSAWNLGYEFTWHQGRGAPTLRSTLDRDNVLEHRLNVRYDLQFSQKIWLNILLSVDLDEFGTGETWEGGNIQFLWIL